MNSFFVAELDLRDVSISDDNDAPKTINNMKLKLKKEE